MKKSLLTVSVMVLSVAATQNALAGFEWALPAKVAPVENNTGNEDNGALTPMVAPAPAAAVEMAPPEEVPPQEAGMKTLSSSMKKAEPVAPANELPVPTENVDMPATQPLTPMEGEQAEWAKAEAELPAPAAEEQVAVKNISPRPQMAPAAPMPLDMTAVQGFGNDIPLALALRQVVPANYNFQFVPPVNAGARVSWSGGKPWLQVVQDMAASQGLAAELKGSTVVISSSAAAAAPQPAPQPVPMAQPAPAPAPVADASMQPMPLEDAAAEPVSIVEADPAVEQPAAPVVATERKVMENKIITWQTRSGSSLRETIESWSRSANVDVSWNTPYDYPVNNSFTFHGKYSDAVNALLSQYSREKVRPRGKLYPNMPDGPSVLMVN